MRDVYLKQHALTAISAPQSQGKGNFLQQEKQARHNKLGLLPWDLL